jgi:CRP-like cAMP-binding protein
MPVTPEELAAVPLFSSLSPSELEEVSSWFEDKPTSEGTALTGEGASGYSFFVLADGHAVVTAGGEEIATLGPGDFFGEMAILGGGRRTATVKTTTPARVLALFGTDFRKLQAAHPQIAAQLEATMRARTLSD